jgi:hypothetical protein
VRLLRFPEREVALVALQLAGFLRDHVLEPGATNAATAGPR